MNTQKELVSYLVASGTLVTPQVVSAFEKIDRKDFVRDVISHDEIYADYPLLSGYGQTISQPSTVAFMMELLQPQLNDNILDVGTGSGWTTAILASVVGNGGSVYGVEIVSELVRFGANNLAKYDFVHASIVQSGKMYGLPEYAPYDRILVSAAGNNIPKDLITQLAIGGVMVIPVKNEILCYIKNADEDDTIEHFYGFSFVPLTKPIA